ncbi:MAG: lamin tail domain-containing protein [Gammaproteobacteria bacterium]|nr:lamin tail domain-containing protein [Gammaproteobacteria bacterium]
MENNLIRNIKTVQLINASLILLGISTAEAALIINEVDYDQPGSDTAEFIELFNAGMSPVVLDGYTIDLVNGSNGSAYSSFDLTGLTVSANGYLVLCDNLAAVTNCNIDVTSSGWIQNGGSDGDAVALLSGGTLVDSVVYEGMSSFLAPYAEGGSFTIADSNSISMSIGRLPNGIDSNTNSADFNSACITPGSGNISGTGDCSLSVSAVPLPAAAWLFGSGLLGLIGISRRKLSNLS